MLAAAALLVIGWMIAVDWRPGESEFPRQGISVSQQQGAIDWQALPDTVDFAFIKASEGDDHRDPRFAENWAGARRAGIARGAYHGFTLCATGADQANNFIAAVPPAPDMLPPAIDLEFRANCSQRPTPDALAADLTEFLHRVEARYGRRAILYLTREFDEGYGISARFPGRALWLRSTVLRPDWGARPWSYWQASSFRRIPGIAGPVDWNVAARP